MATNELIFVLAWAFICGLSCAAIAFFLFRKDRPLKAKDLERRAREDQEFLQSSYFNTTSGIMRETTRHRTGGRNNRY